MRFHPLGGMHIASTGHLANLTSSFPKPNDMSGKHPHVFFLKPTHIRHPPRFGHAAMAKVHNTNRQKADNEPCHTRILC